MIIDIIVVPKSGRFAVSVKDGKIKVFLKSAAEDNKANLELIKEFSKLTSCEVRIVSGLKSRRKKIELDLGELEFMTAISDQF
ncbi:DUF167 domain-containing protein [Candidatus Micrarchaeota archaeon]|nr:DUF167 domain-containing protein [Candidatus Micrarchaeota archaeon]MBU1165982.1 DUF167 domain-containing protein [Candidatus Micrarchaeota archaeon]MBU1886441.1 DUF167 domain-containing protein [Candidatus Micrarchaeota archaeon]